MKEKIYAKIGISNRHIHLTKETYDKLFDEELTIKNELNQAGEYAANQTVTIKSPKGKIENVRIIGPLRNYNQVEISATDAYDLGLNPPVRQSGDLENSETITIIGPNDEVTLDNACIIAQRHVHMNENKAMELGLKHEDIVNIKVNNAKGGIMKARVKVSPNGFYEIHIDRDDANSFLLKSGDEVEIER